MGDPPRQNAVLFCDCCRTAHVILADGKMRKLTREEELNVGWFDRCPHCRMRIQEVSAAQKVAPSRVPADGEGFFCMRCGKVSLYRCAPDGSQRLALRGVPPDQERDFPLAVREQIAGMRKAWAENAPS